MSAETPEVAPAKTKRIVIHYLPSIGADPIVLESSTERVSYGIDSNVDGILGYKAWRGNHTVFVPREHCLRMEVDL